MSIDLNGYQRVSNYIMCFFNIPITIGITALLIGALISAYDNTSTIEAMKKDTQRRFPIFPKMKDKHLSQIPNKYDVLWPNNFRSVFGPYLILWPVPFYCPEFCGNGLYFPKTDEVPVERFGVMMRDNEGF